MQSRGLLPQPLRPPERSNGEHLAARGHVLDLEPLAGSREPYGVFAHRVAQANRVGGGIGPTARIGDGPLHPLGGARWSVAFLVATGARDA